MYGTVGMFKGIFNYPDANRSTPFTTNERFKYIYTQLRAFAIHGTSVKYVQELEKMVAPTPETSSKCASFSLYRFRLTYQVDSCSARSSFNPSDSMQILCIAVFLLWSWRWKKSFCYSCEDTVNSDRWRCVGCTLHNENKIKWDVCQPQVVRNRKGTLVSIEMAQEVELWKTM